MRQDGIALRAQSEIDRLLSLGVIRAEELLPCSEAEVAAIDRAIDLRLPESYRLYLRIMGRGAGRFLKSDHWTAFYDDLLTLNKNVRKNLVGVAVPSDWFCFATRMGEAYLFFAADGASDDPPIQCWSEATDPKFETAFRSFWDWIAEMVSDSAR